MENVVGICSVSCIAYQSCQENAKGERDNADNVSLTFKTKFLSLVSISAQQASIVPPSADKDDIPSDPIVKSEEFTTPTAPNTKIEKWWNPKSKKNEKSKQFQLNSNRESVHENGAILYAMQWSIPYSY